MAAYTGHEKRRAGPTSAKTKYPKNHVIQTEAGHLIEYDNTEGACRIKIAHKSGTHFEIQEDGKMSMIHVGNKEEYNKGGVTCTIDENGDFKVAGHNRQNNSGGKHESTLGDSDSATGGHSTVIVGGNAKVVVAGDSYTGVVGNHNMNIGGSVSMKVAGNMTMETAGTHTIKAAKISMNP